MLCQTLKIAPGIAAAAPKCVNRGCRAEVREREGGCEAGVLHADLDGDGLDLGDVHVGAFAMVKPSA